MNNMDHNQNTITNILRIDNNTNFRNIGKQKNTKICDLPNDFMTFITIWYMCGKINAVPYRVVCFVNKNILSL